MNATARLILIIVLILLVLGLLPVFPWANGFGWYPAGGLGTVLVIVIILVLLDKI